MADSTADPGSVPTQTLVQLPDHILPSGSCPVCFTPLRPFEPVVPVVQYPGAGMPLDMAAPPAYVHPGCLLRVIR